MSRLPCLTKDNEMSALGDGLLLNSRSRRNVRSDRVADKKQQWGLLKAFRFVSHLVSLLYRQQLRPFVLTL
jgi:hypothetical protein